MFMLPLCFSLTVKLRFQSNAVVLPGPSCPKKCGDVDIEFPFGIGADCAIDHDFKLDCNKTTDGHSYEAWYSDMPVLNISLLHGQVWMKNYISYMCTNRSNGTIFLGQTYLDLSNTAFTFSADLNKFTVVGMNTLAYMIGSTYVLGCLSLSSPYDNSTAQDGSCTGVGCCQVELTSNMSYYRVYFNEEYNTSTESITDNEEYCGYGVMMEADAFRFRTAYLNRTAFWDDYGGRVPVVLNWAVGNETCGTAKNADSYACRSNNSVCIDSSNGPGYLCNCTEGYQGNPYLPNGCQANL
nr:unnamed protein product [Digitaria exilis]